MRVHYGYKDASGDFYVTIDTDMCDGCGDCATACPAGGLEVVREDPNDPLRDEPVAVVKEDKKRKLKYECGPCKPVSGRSELPCVRACTGEAIAHSW